jgi:hypothetical protein
VDRRVTPVEVGDPLVLNGVFGCVTGIGAPGTVAIVLADRAGMPGETWSFQEQAAAALRDAFLAVVPKLEAAGHAPIPLAIDWEASPD